MEACAHLGYARYVVPASEDTGTANALLLARPAGAWPTTSETAAKAERDDDIDLGVEQKLEDLTLGVYAYWRHARNLLDAVRISSTVLSRPFNYERGKAWGVELTVTYTEGPLSIWGNLAVARIEGRTIIAGRVPFTAAQLQWIASHDVTTNGDQRVTGSLGAAWHSGNGQRPAPKHRGRNAQWGANGGQCASPSGGCLSAGAAAAPPAQCAARCAQRLWRALCLAGWHVAGWRQCAMGHAARNLCGDRTGVLMGNALIAGRPDLRDPLTWLPQNVQDHVLGNVPSLIACLRAPSQYPS